jgi:NAD(P)H-hydrate epimerase
MKQGLLKHPARAKAGELHPIDIGIGEISKYLPERLPEMITSEIVKRYLPERPYESHKGTFGTCFVVAGTQSYTGAAYLTGKAAYRAGCGLVHIATPASVHQSLAGHLPEAVWTILPEVDGGYGEKGIEKLVKTISGVDSLVIGPGWGLAQSNISFLKALLESIPREIPTVFDADGLKLLSQIPQWWQLLPANSILTPHPGEMSILTGLETSEIQSNRWEIAKKYAEKWGVCLLLKGAETVVADHEGSLWVNPISEPALATAGSGDVLSGLIGGLLAQGTFKNKATVASVWLHGQAGILAKAELGTDRCVTAVDILNSIPGAFGLI